MVTGQELEPNDGTTTTEYNVVAVGATVSGAIGVADDTDLFKVDVPPGKLLTFTLTPKAGSSLVPNLTVIDAGRSGGNPGEDYVKIITRKDSGTLTMEVVTMGKGGYIAIVRDARNVSDNGTFGGADFTYSLNVATSNVPIAATLTNGATGNGTLSGAGGVVVYKATTGDGNLMFDVKHTGTTNGIAPRAFAYSTVQEDWVARQDDRAQTDVDPLIDAPVPAGELWLVIENVAQTASALGFSYALTLP